MDNPLASMRPQAGPQGAPDLQNDPMVRHAMMWAHMQQQPPEALQKHVKIMDYALPIMGALAADKDVTAKDVIKAVSGAVADLKITPSEGVSFISQMPADSDKLTGWLRQTYADSLTATVHAKEALLRGPQPSGPPQMAPQMGGGEPSPSVAPGAPQGVGQ